MLVRLRTYAVVESSRTYRSSGHRYVTKDSFSVTRLPWPTYVSNGTTLINQLQRIGRHTCSDPRSSSRASFKLDKPITCAEVAVQLFKNEHSGEHLTPCWHLGNGARRASGPISSAVELWRPVAANVDTFHCVVKLNHTPCWAATVADRGIMSAKQRLPQPRTCRCEGQSRTARRGRTSWRSPARQG